MEDQMRKIKDYVLDAVANDYESFDIVLKDVTDWAADEGVRVTHGDILWALGDLIREGLAQAYVLSTAAPHAQTVEYSPERAEELWFYVTPKGKALADSV